MRTVRVLIRRAAVVSIVAAAVLFLALVFFSSGPGERIIRRAVETKMSAALGGRVVIGNLETNLFSRLDLDDIELYRAEDRPPSIELDSCTLTFSLSRLLRRTLLVSSVDLDGLAVTITRDSSGLLDVPPAGDGGEGGVGFPLAVEIGAVRVTNSRIEYEDAAGNSYRAESLDLALLRVDDEFYAYRIAIGSCSGVHGGIGFALRDLSAEGQIADPLGGPRLEARAGFSGLDIAGVPTREGELEFSYSPAGLSLRRAELLFDEGELSASGNLSIDSLLTYELSVELADIDVPGLYRLFVDAPSPYEGILSGRFEGAGRVDDMGSWIVTGVVEMSGCRYRGRKIDDFSGGVDMRGGRLALRVHQDYFEISGETILSEDELDGRFQARISDLGPVAALAGRSGVRGALRIDGAVSGTMGDPDVSADFSAIGVEYLGFAVDTIAGGLFVRGRSIGLSNVTFSGTIDDIGSLEPPLVIPELGGGISYRGSAEGVIDAIRADVRIELSEPSYRGIAFESGRLAVHVGWPLVEISSMELRRDTLLVMGGGEARITERRGRCELVFSEPAGADTLSPRVSSGGGWNEGGIREVGRLEALFEMPGEEWRLSAKGSGIDIGWAVSLAPRPIVLSGRLDFGLDARGGILPGAATVRFRAEDPGYVGVHADSVKGIVSLDGTRLSVDSLELHLGDDQLRLAASMRLEEGGAGGFAIDENGIFTGSVQGDGLDLALVERFLPDGADLGGIVTFDLVWSGTPARIRPSGRLSLRRGSVRIRPSDPPVVNIVLESVLDDSLLVIENLTGSVQDRQFEARGRLQLGAGPAIGTELEIEAGGIASLRMKGSYSPDSLDMSAVIDRLDLETLGPYFENVDSLSGILSAQIGAEGPPSGPRLNGLLTIRRLALRPEFMKEPFDGGNVRIVFDDEKIGIDSLLLRRGSGSVFVSGSLAHERGSLREIDITARIDRIDIEDQSSYAVSLESAMLRYKTEGEQFLLEGDIVLGETRVRADFKPQSILPFVRSVERPVQEPPEFLERTKIDVRIRESDNIWIDNNIARIRMRSDLRIIGTAANPNVTGRVAVAKGYVLFIDRKFKIEEGTVDFIDPNRLNPVVALRAVTRVTSYRAMEATPYTVTLSVTGPLDEASVELYSDPPLDRANIVSLLTLGVTREQLTGGEEGGDVSTRGVLFDRAKAVTSDRLGGYISRNVEDLFMLDQVTIEGDLFDFGSSWGPQLVASKRISKRTTMTYRTNVGHLNERSITLDYLLTERFSLSGETDQYGRSGIDLKFTIRLR